MIFYEYSDHIVDAGRAPGKLCVSYRNARDYDDIFFNGLMYVQMAEKIFTVKDLTKTYLKNRITYNPGVEVPIAQEDLVILLLKAVVI
jgi:hypothetical protein